MKNIGTVFGIVLVIVLFAFVSNGMAETYEEKYSRCAKECYPPFIDCYSNICTGYDEDECRACRLKCHEVHEKCFTICMDEVITTMDLTVTTDKKTYSPGDVVLISGKVFNASGGIGNAKVDIELGKIGMFTSTLIAQVDTNSNGDYNYNFPLPLGFDHAEYAITVIAKVPEYEDVIAMGDFTVGEVPLRIEDNPVTGKPYVGVVADGVSYLNVSISLPECSRLKFTTPVIGRLEGDYIDPVTNEIMLSIVDGSAELKYYPPKYLTSSQLTQNLDVHQTGSLVWTAEVPLTFTYIDVEGTDCKLEVKILVCQPPIMMVHGFLGSPITWSQMSDHLRKEKFDTYLGDYRIPDVGIGGISLVLRQYIAEQKDDYARADIKIAKVDIIAHSMGGLISRCYVQGIISYPGDVRKLIMVATPNHGTIWIKMQLGKLGAAWYKMHQKPALQLHSDSDFFKELNAGENVGNHLNHDVQYAHVYGFPNDWIVSAASAYLEGVEYSFAIDVKHSADIPDLPGKKFISITESQDVWDEVKTWLTRDINKPLVGNTYAYVSELHGHVSLVTKDTSGSHEKKVEQGSGKPFTSQTLKTYSDSNATVILRMNAGIWGVVFVDQNSEITFGHFSPSLVEVYLTQGKATFSSRKKDGHFTVPVQITKSDGSNWWKCHPKAVVTGLDTEFDVGIMNEKELVVFCYEGKLIVESPEGETITLSANESTTVRSDSIKTIEPVKDDDANNVSIDIDYVCPQNLTLAYQQYIFAYNKLLYLKKNRDGDSPELLAAYEMYKKTKECYENLSEQCSDTSNDVKQQLLPEADGDVYEYTYLNWNWANWGMFDSLSAGWNPTGGEKRAYLKFDIPSNVTIDRAILKLFQYHYAGVVRDLDIHRITSSWIEGTSTYHHGEAIKPEDPDELCWMQQPSFDPQPLVTFTPTNGSWEWVDVDITPLVQQWQNGTPNYGLLIKTSNKNPTSNDPEAMAMFYSKDHPDQSSHPLLEITIIP